MAQDKTGDMITVEMVGIKDEREELLIKLWWNEAITACINKLQKEFYAANVVCDIIRDLKK